MKTRAVFLVVWVPHAETSEDVEYEGMRFRNHSLPYWLDYVRNAANDVCPIIVVQNQCESPEDELQPPAILPESLHVQTVHYSARTDRNRQSLNEALAVAVKHLRDREGVSTIGIGRARVRRQILEWIDEDARTDAPSKKQYRLLSYEDFVTLCEYKQDVSSPAHLLDYLHNAGIVFYQKGLFNNQIILDQSWALDAIYTVFHRDACYRQLKALKGRFTMSVLKSLVWEEYSCSEQQVFLSLMTSCGVCFVHQRFGRLGTARSEIEYVAPDFEEIEHELEGRWQPNAEAILRRCWNFEFLNPALVRGIISDIGSVAGASAVYWKYGLWTHDNRTASSAFVSRQMIDDRAGSVVLECYDGRAEELLDRLTKVVQGRLDGAGYGTVKMEGLPIRDEEEELGLG